MREHLSSSDSLPSLLTDAAAQGVELALDPADPAQLRYRPVLLAPDLVARLRRHKTDVLAMLRGEGLPDESDPDTGAGYIMVERLGVASDLEMPTHPGSPAWLMAVGELLAAFEVERTLFDCG